MLEVKEMPTIDLVELFEKFLNQWIALDEDNERIVGNGSTIQEAVEKAEKNGVKEPILLYVSPQLATCVV